MIQVVQAEKRNVINMSSVSISSKLGDVSLHHRRN